MSRSTIGHMKKHARLVASQEAWEGRGDVVCVHIMRHRDGRTTAVFTEYENAVEWEVFADAACSRHLPWEHPLCNPQNRGGRRCTPLELMSWALDNGFDLVRTECADGEVLY